MELPTDHRALLIAQLAAYAQRCSESQREVTRRMQEFVASTPECFQRSHPAGHITGSAWLINPTGDKVLLTLHRKLRKWLQPGGHADGDPVTLRVSLREAEEESGIRGITPVSWGIFDVDIHTIPASPGIPEHLHYDVRYLLRAPHETFAVSQESLALGWFRHIELAFLSPAPDASVLRMAGICGDF